MNKTKSNKAITLVALIITIIVLLILAVVSIRAVNDAGIIQHAQDTSDKYTIAQEEEELKLNVLEWQLDNKNGVPTLEYFFKAKYGDNNVKNNGDGTLTVIIEKTQNKYIVTDIGEVTAEGENGGSNGEESDTGGAGTGENDGSDTSDEDQTTTQHQIGAVANLEIGDYISYNGSTWVVFYNDDTNGLQIVPQNPTTTVNLYGINGNIQKNISYGYENQVTYSKQLCANFINSDLGAIDCRAAGGQHGYNNNDYEIKEIYKMELSDGTIVTMEAESPNSTDTNPGNSDGNNIYAISSKVQLPNFVWIPGASRYCGMAEDDETINSDSQFGTIILNTSTFQTQQVDLITYNIATKTLTENSLINDEITSVVMVPSVLIDKRITITGGTGETIDTAYTYTFNQ